MNKLDIANKFADMWRRSREDAGVSQKYMAKALGVSRATIQNWENGLSCPSQIKSLEWFGVLGVQPLPYYMEILYPSDENITDTDMDNTLALVISNMPARLKAELLYLLQGLHGSTPSCVLEMITAYLQTPLEFRLNVASGISINYEVCEARGILKNPDEIQPDMNLLHKAIRKGQKAVVEGKDYYVCTNIDRS